MGDLEVNYPIIIPQTANYYTSFCTLKYFLSSFQDNERLRALNDMMGGVLEVKKEDILKMVSCVSAISQR